MSAVKGAPFVAHEQIESGFAVVCMGCRRIVRHPEKTFKLTHAVGVDVCHECVALMAVEVLREMKR